MRAAIIIPALNEEARIGKVLEAATRSNLASEVIVVCDGCHDDTAQIAGGFLRVKVIDLRTNIGKGGAMAIGAANTACEVLTFVDADLTGLQPEHIDRLIHPVLTGAADMCIGVFRGGKFWSEAAQRISPYISGQRAVRREIFESIPYLAEARLGVEVAINTFAKRAKARVIRVVLHGVSNTYKEKKMGLVKGATARAIMYAEIGKAMVKAKRRYRARRAA
jgi:glycosyltransferase involved in cell wall biosynthesis